MANNLGTDAGESSEFTWSGFTCDQFPYTSAATPPTCAPTCLTCREQYLPKLYTDIKAPFPLSFHDDAKALSIITDLVETSTANYAYIRTQINKHGNTIAKRWLKREGARQKKLILDVKPNMYQAKHAEVDLAFTFLAQIRAGRKQRDIIDKFEDVNLVPYLNVQSPTEGV